MLKTLNEKFVKPLLFWTFRPNLCFWWRIPRVAAYADSGYGWNTTISQTSKAAKLSFVTSQQPWWSHNKCSHPQAAVRRKCCTVMWIPAGQPPQEEEGSCSCTGWRGSRWHSSGSQPAGRRGIQSCDAPSTSAGCGCGARQSVHMVKSPEPTPARPITELSPDINMMVISTWCSI